jgi:ribosome maturation factor RimP
LKTTSKESTKFKGRRNNRPPKKSKGPKENEVIKSVWDLAEPLCLSEGMELVQVEYHREPGGRILRIYIDRPGNVTLNDCTVISRQLSDVLDVYLGNNIPPYHLEVSSPGGQRPLSRLKDFERFKGRKARIRIKMPMNGRRNFMGILEGCSNDIVHLKVGTERIDVIYQNIAKAKLVNHNGEN